ncbi:MAG: N-acetylmuramoyl-L-alanine amidase [Planctomycetota bacterium]|jgi:N-acetylmuramoyl-L-alanine amidase
MNPAGILVLALLGAAPAPQPVSPAVAAVKINGRNYVSVPVMMRRNRLRMTVNERAGIYTLMDGSRRIVIVPGFSVADVDGRRVNLAHPAIFHRGELMVPTELFSTVQRVMAAPRPVRPPVRRVMLDPGHGGRDSGAVGLGGLREKDVALSVALRLKRLLEARGVGVSMTRSSDRFIPLMERSSAANRSGADLFLSIHCNASRTRAASGIETFALSWGISDSYRAGKAALRHNPADMLQGAASGMGSTAERTVFRAHMSEQRRRSTGLARTLQSEMVRHLGGIDRGVKRRNFSVLRETYIPAALAEVGFISHPSTERRMRTSAYRQRIAEALAAGVCSYGRAEQGRLNRIAGRPAPSGAEKWPKRPDHTASAPSSASRTTAARRSRRYRTLSANSR